MSNTDPNAKSNPASESTSPRTLSPTTSLRTKKSRNTLYRYFFGADGRATRKDVPGEEYDPDFSDMPGTPEIRAAAARRVAIRRALGGTSMLSTLSDEELELVADTICARLVWCDARSSRAALATLTKTLSADPRFVSAFLSSVEVLP